MVRFIAPILILALGYAGFKHFGKRPEPPKKEAVDNTGTLVDTIAAESWSEPFVLQVDGESVTYRVVTVAAEVGGQIQEKLAGIRGGSFIAQDGVMFRIDPTDYQLELERLAAQERQATAEIDSIAVAIANNRDLIKLAEEELNLQKKQLDRIATLLGREATSESALDTARQQELTARNSLQRLENEQRTQEQRKITLEASRDLVKAQSRRARIDLERTEVRAPINGTIVSDIVEQGNYVKKGDPLVYISDSSRMEIKCQLRADELGWVWLQKHGPTGQPDNLEFPETPVHVVLDFQGSKFVWDGLLSRFEGTGVDANTRTFPCRVRIDNPRVARLDEDDPGLANVTPPTLLSGMFVTIRIPIKTPAPMLRVPLEAVRPGGKLWVIRNNELHIVDCSVARTQPEFALLRDDGETLRAGERVVVSPLPSVYNQMPVQDNSIKFAEKEANQ